MYCTSTEIELEKPNNNNILRVLFRYIVYQLETFLFLPLLNKSIEWSTLEVKFQALNMTGFQKRDKCTCFYVEVLRVATTSHMNCPVSLVRQTALKNSTMLVRLALRVTTDFLSRGKRL